MVSGTDTVVFFSPHQEYVQRVLSVVASSLSITAGLIAFYTYISMRVKVFRHHLILLLLMFDFGKAVVLLWYPARVLNVPSAYNNVNFCDVVGFFTSCFIQGADFAVLSLAVHTALLVFTKNSGPEGGLYKYRYWVYTSHVLLPILMAGLAFVGTGRQSYIPLVTWCYLPIYPRWSRLVLSWVPRYIILVSIFSIYLAVYIYVKLEYRKVVKDFKQSQTYIINPPTGVSHGFNDADLTAHDFTSNILGSSDLEMNSPAPITNNSHNFNNILLDDDSDDPSTPTKINKPSVQNQNVQKSKFNIALRKFSRRVGRSFLIFISYFPGFGFLTPHRYLNDSDPENDKNLDATTIAIRDFQRESMANFQLRRNLIERQIRSIFVYPVAYVFLWIAPFAVHAIQFNYNTQHTGVYWISAIAAFMQPFNCVVDTLAFCIRERPWVDRKEKIFTKENGDLVKYWLSRVMPCFVECPPDYLENGRYGAHPQNNTSDNTMGNDGDSKAEIPIPRYFLRFMENNASSNSLPNTKTTMGYSDKTSMIDPYDDRDNQTSPYQKHVTGSNNKEAINSNSNINNNNNNNNNSSINALHSSTRVETKPPSYPPSKERHTSGDSEDTISTDATYPHNVPSREFQTPESHHPLSYTRSMSPSLLAPPVRPGRPLYTPNPAHRRRPHSPTVRSRSSSPHSHLHTFLGRSRSKRVAPGSNLVNTTSLDSSAIDVRTSNGSSRRPGEDEQIFGNTTAKRVNFKDGRRTSNSDNDDDDNTSSSEMDILEFLR